MVFFTVVEPRTESLSTRPPCAGRPPELLSLIFLGVVAGGLFIGFLMLLIYYLVD